MQTAEVDLLDIDPLGLVEDEPVWPTRSRSLEHMQGRHRQQDHAGDGVAGAADKLKLAGRIPLMDGEELVGSDVFEPRQSGHVPMALTSGPSGRRLRVGTGIADEDKKRWAGRDRGQTVNLDEEGIRRFRGAIEEMRIKGDEGGRQFQAIERREEELDQQRRDILKRQYRGLSKTEAKRLDQLNRRIEAADDEITRREQGLRDTARYLAENDPDGKRRWDEIFAEIASLDPGDDADARRIQQLEDEVGRIPPSPRTRDTLRVLPQLREERDRLGAERQELTANATPLTAEDQAELTAVEVEIARNAAEHQEMEEIVLVDGVISGEWADLAYRVTTAETTHDYDNLGISYRIAARPKNADVDWDFGEDYGATELEPDDLVKLGRMVERLVAETRSPESTVIPVSVASFALLSASPAVQLMMYARAVEAKDTFMRAGHSITVNRGKGGKFAKKGLGDAVMAAAKAATSRRDDTEHSLRMARAELEEIESRGTRRFGTDDPDKWDDETSSQYWQVRQRTSELERERDATQPDSAPAEKAGAKPRRSAVAKALASGNPNALDGVGREALRREAKARGLEPPRGVSEDVLKDMLWDDENAAMGAGGQPGGRGNAEALRIRLRQIRGQDVVGADNRREIEAMVAGVSKEDLRAIYKEMQGFDPFEDDEPYEDVRRDFLTHLLIGRSYSKWRSDTDTPSPTPDEAVDVLKKAKAGDGGQVRALLEEMRDADLFETASRLSKEMGTVPQPKAGQARQSLIDDVYEGTVGFRDRAKAIGGNWGSRQTSTTPAMGKPVSPRPARPGGRPVARTIPSIDSTPEENAIAIMGGRNVWQEMRAGGRAEPDTAPAGGISSVTDRLDAIRAEVPQDGKAQFAEVLAPLSHKELDAIAEHYGWGVSKGTKAQKRQRLAAIGIDGRVHQKAIAGGGWGDSPNRRDDSAGAALEVADAENRIRAAMASGGNLDSELADMSPALRQVAMQRIAANPAGQSVPRRAGARAAGPSPETRAKVDALVETIPDDATGMRGFTEDVLAGRLRVGDVKVTAARQKARALRTAANAHRTVAEGNFRAVPSPEMRDKRDAANRRAERMEAIADALSGSERQAKGEPGGRSAAGPSPETRAEIAAIVAAPTPPDRERLRGIFSKMTIPQLKKWAADNGFLYDSTGPKSQQVGRLVEHAIGFRLNSQAIRYGGWQNDGRDRVGGNPTGTSSSGAAGDRPVLSNRWNAPGTRTLTGGSERRAARERAIQEDRERAVSLGTPRLSDDEMDGRIAAAYSALSGRDNELVSLVRLRAELADIPTDEINAALKRLDRGRVIQLSPDPNQKALPDLAHIAALPVGGTDNHFVSFRSEDVNRLGGRGDSPK